MKKQIKFNNAKKGVIIIILSLLMYNCQNNDFDEQIEQQVTIKKISFETLEQKKGLRKVLSNISKKSFFNNSYTKNAIASDLSFIILTDDVILETLTDSTTNYTFPLQRPIHDDTIFENFIISKFGNEYNYFIAKYELSTENNFQNISISFSQVDESLIDINDFTKTGGNNVIDADPCVEVIYAPCVAPNGREGGADGHAACEQPDGGMCTGSFPVYIDTSGCFGGWGSTSGGYVDTGSYPTNPNQNGSGSNNYGSPNGATAVIKDVNRNYLFELISSNFSKTDPVWDLFNGLGTLGSDINTLFKNNNNSQDVQVLILNLLNEINDNPNINTFEQSLNNVTLFDSKDPATSTILNIQNDIIDCFDTTTNQNGFHSITIYIDQPIANSTDTYKIENGDVNVGHTFIELEQSSNLTINRKVFGFYPSNSVSPSEPEVTGALVYDDNHEYDVSLRIELTPNQFNDIISIMDNFNNNPLPYNLNDFNCSDFGLSIINSSGANINDTFGEWSLAGMVLGGGTNPGNLGQDIRNLENNLPSNALDIDTNGGNANNSTTPCN